MRTGLIFRLTSGADLPAPLPMGLLLASLLGGTLQAQFAAEVVEHLPGQGASGAFADPTAALGPPTRLSGTPMEPSVVSPFQPAWRPGELVTIGAGGHLVIAFEEPVEDHPGNPFGIDLIIFGNAFFTAADQNVPCTGALYAEGGVISVSSDGNDFITIEDTAADGLYPTLGYQDAHPFGSVAGSEPTDFTRPVDPGLADLVTDGLCWEELLLVYDGSGGGTPIDLAPTGLESIRFVRISVPEDPSYLPEVDAVADVAPGTVPADLDGDGRVDGVDLTMLLSAWNETDSPLDLDGDGTITGKDLVLLLGAWD